MTDHSTHHPPDPAREAQDRKAVIEYQASYLVEAFGIPMQDALRLIGRHGVDRKRLLSGLQLELGRTVRKFRTRAPGR